MPMLKVFALLLAVAAPAAAQPLLRPVPLVAGQPDTVLVADLFTDTSGLEFGRSPEVVTSYDAEAGTLALAARRDFEGLALVPFRQHGDVLVLPVRSRILTPQRFSFWSEERAREVFLIGQFNDWSRSATPLTDADGDGVWETTVPLESGRYEYKFTADGVEVLDPGNPTAVPNGLGGMNNVLAVPPRHEASVTLLTLPATDEHLRFAFLRDGEPADVRRMDVIALVGNQELDAASVTVGGHEIGVQIMPEMAGKTVRVAVRQDGQATRFATVTLGDGFAWRDAVLYQIMIDRWADGDTTNSVPVAHDSLAARANYYGGDLQGILDRMEEGYFDVLGVNVLWLSPVVDNTDRAYREYPAPHRYYTGYHGYWPTDPEVVESRFGDIELLRAVVDAAHARGMKVLLDYVANHVHEEHPYFQQHRDWFGVLDLPDGRKNLRLWDEQRLTTWFEPYLPSFDYQSSDEALTTMTDNAIWWLEQSGADGFRHDAVKHIPNRFWRTLTRKLRAEIDSARVARGRPPAYQIGETFGSYDLISSYVTPGQLDAQFNFNLYDAAKYVFLDSTASFGVLAAEMEKTLDVYGPDHVMGNLMDSHDKPRFLAYADGDLALDAADDKEIGWTTEIAVDDAASYRRAELYLAYLLTTPGVPTIYYGDEIGMTGVNDPDNRRPMRFGSDVTPDERRLKNQVAALVKLRTEHAALRRGGFHTLRAEGDLWIYLRDDPSGAVLVALNKGATGETVTLDLPLPGRTATDALDEGAVESMGERLTLDVPADGYRVITLD